MIWAKHGYQSVLQVKSAGCDIELNNYHALMNILNTVKAVFF